MTVLLDSNNPLKATLRPKDEHSLFFSSQQAQDEWFQMIQRHRAYQPLLEEIKKEATRLLEEPMEVLSYNLFTLFAKTGERLPYERVYFAKRRRLNTFVFMSLLEPENDHYHEQLHEVIWSICNEYTWCLPAHINDGPEMITEKKFSLTEESTQYTIDLFAAETAFALSEILELTKSFLDPQLQNRIVYEVHRRVLWPYMQQSYHWETATHNWAAVCAGSIGAVALHLFTDLDELSFILSKVLATLEYYLAGFHDDGTCLEGYGYWQYGFGFYVYFADLLKRRTNQQVNLFDQPKVEQIALFQQKSFLYKNTVVNFSDALSTTHLFLGLSHYLANIYEDVVVPESELRAPYTEDHTSRWAPAFRNLFWFNPELIGKPWPSQSYYLQDSAWLISRHATAAGHFAFAAKGGHNDEPHNHNDLGHFILQRDGEVFLTDLGSGEYNDEYFGTSRYSFLCNGSRGHSVPIINGKDQQAGANFYAIVKQAVLTNERIDFSLDLTHAYDIPTMVHFLRTLTWETTDLPTLTLIDSYTFTDQPVSLIERFVTPILTFEECDDGIILLGKERLLIQFNDEQLDFQQKPYEFINHFGNKETILALDFYVKDLQPTCTITFTFKFLDS